MICQPFCGKILERVSEYNCPGGAGNTPGLGNRKDKFLMHPHHNREPYFPANLDEYAPWVAAYGLTAPYGKCQCGCGESTSIAPKSNYNKGLKRNHPLRFRNGHGSRITVDVAPWVRKHGLIEPYGYCQCGCGQRTTVADHTDRHKGLYRGHPRRYLHGHHQSKNTLADAFWQYVQAASEEVCWNWEGTKRQDGYGQFKHNDELYVAHRASWIIHHGPIPDEMIICHKCDNPQCVNPHHLFLGTHADNMADKVSKGRQAKRGETAKKLTRRAVSSIREAYAQGATQASLAEKYGVTMATISRVVTRKVWRNV